MNYLNLETKLLTATEYIGSEPRARATWLNVVLWSALHENSGRIVAARGWKDRQWQQTCGVTSREVDSASPLLVWDGDDLIVWSYPIDQEEIVISRRESGRIGGQAKTEAKAQAARVNGTQAKAQAEPKQNPSTIPNVKERKEKEGKEIRSSASLPTRERNELFDVMVEVTGQNPAVSGGEIGAALKSIKSLSPDVTPEEIRRRATNYKTQFRDAAISASALAKWWAKCSEAGPGNQNGRASWL